MQDPSALALYIRFDFRSSSSICLRSSVDGFARALLHAAGARRLVEKKRRCFSRFLLHGSRHLSVFGTKLVVAVLARTAVNCS